MDAFSGICSTVMKRSPFQTARCAICTGVSLQKRETYKLSVQKGREWFKVNCQRQETGIMDSFNPMRKYKSKGSKGSLRISLSSLPTTSFVHCFLPLLRLRLPLKLRHAALVGEAENMARTMFKIQNLRSTWNLTPALQSVWVAVGSQAVRFLQLKHHITQRLELLAHLQHVPTGWWTFLQPRSLAFWHFAVDPGYIQ